jgi:hypothetical protein
MNLQEEYLNLKEQIGDENLQIDFLMETKFDVNDLKTMYSKVRLTYLPTGKQYFGEDYETQIENGVDALKKIIKDIS